jgi:predicted SnoaL-like aldol condensation-catalyzing enzyme
VRRRRLRHDGITVNKQRGRPLDRRRVRPCPSREDLAMRRTAFFSAIVTLLLVAAIASLAAAALLPQPSLESPRPLDERAVQRFYTAVNTAIATGNTAPLRAAVAPHFVDQEPLPGVRSGRDGLEEYVALLHAAAPETRLAAETVAAVDDRAVVRVAVQTVRAAEPTLATLGWRPALWGPVDVLRVANDKIVERWSATVGQGLVQPLARVAFDLPAPPPPVVTVARYTLAAGAVWTSRHPGPRVLLVEPESPGVSVAISAPPGGSAPTEPPRPDAAGRSAMRPGTPVSLAAGQSLVMIPEARYDARNAGEASARLWVVAFDVPRVANLAQGGAETLPPDVSAQTFASDLATDIRPGPTGLAVEAVTLGPGGRLTLAEGTGPRVVALVTGRVGIASSEPVWVRRGTDGFSDKADTALLTPGGGLLMPARGILALENHAAEAAEALVVTVQPDSG